MADWHDLGEIELLKQKPLQTVRVKRGIPLAVTYQNNAFGVVSGVCNHVGGPLGDGRLDGEYIVCPWHHWKFHRCTGSGEPGYEADKVPAYATKEEGGRLWVDLDSVTPRERAPHQPHRLVRPIEREPGGIRVAGLATTAMHPAFPRYSTSDALLEAALSHAESAHGAATRLIRVRDLKFRECEGYYSKSARACTWPCSITQMDAADEMEQVYEAVVHWADVVLVATPIRWGSASSLYYKMAERMNCIQNAITIRNQVLIQNKVAAFIITGGQDNIQAVAGQMLNFFGELGFHFPQFPYIAHSRGWSSEDMERNVAYVQKSAELREGAEQLAARAIGLAESLLQQGQGAARTPRGGRKAHCLDVERAAAPA